MVGDAAHAGEHDGVLDVEQFGESSAHGGNLAKPGNTDLPMTLSIDDLVADRYRISGQTDAHLYDAVDERFGRRVAIKVVDDTATAEEVGVLDGGVHLGQRFLVLTVHDETFVAEPEEEFTAAMPVVGATRAVPTVEPTRTVTRRPAAPQRSMVPLVAAVLAAVVVIGVLALALGQNDSDTPKAPAAESSTTQPTTASTAPPRTQATTRATAPPVTEPPTTEPPATVVVTTPPPTSPPATDAPVSDAAPATTTP